MFGHRLEHDRQALLSGVIVKWSLTPCSPLFWLQACLLFFCFSNSSFAFIPATTVWTLGGSIGASPSALCTAAGYAYVRQGFFQTVTGSPFVSGSNTFMVYNGAEYGWCGTFSGGTNGPQFFQYERCPYPGATRVVSGHLQCEGDPPPPCPVSGTTKKDPIALSGISGQQGIGASMCAAATGADCAIKCNSGIASYNEVSGQSSVYCENYEFTGAGCTNTSLVATSVSTVPSTIKATPVNDPPKSREDCPGGSGFAQVNNVGMCLPSGTQFSGGSSTTTSTSGSVTTTSTTTVSPGGTNTTTTTTTYKDGSGNVTYSGTTTGTDGINQAGNNGQGGEKLNLGDAPVFDQSLPTETNFNIKAQGNPVFSTEIFATTASCPAPITFSAMGKDFSIDFSPICALADIIRGIVLMLSAIVAMRAVVTK
ncbi:MAG: hypothetical protein JSR71_11485 [Proteobacteria bacterium]|nr:hypothetical protein [Pseudomonadota bacterium]